MRASRFRSIADALEAAHGRPARFPLPLGNKPDPLDELIYIMLTVMTEFGVEGAFANLKRRFPTWVHVLAARGSSLVAVLQPIGLSEQRAKRIRLLLREVRRREGSVHLNRLHTMDDAHVEEYLTTLPGVGKKVARCVMLYSLRRDVFPVDAHILRVLQRLGLASDDLSLSNAQDVLQAQVPEFLRYNLHVNLVVHGRTICRARTPKCTECILARQCPSANS
jgi:endonuclease III